MLRKKRGQSTMEYAIIIVVVVAALLAMRIYVKRAAEGKLRSSTDQIGSQFDPIMTTGVETTNVTHITSTVQTIGQGVTETTTRDFRATSSNETVGRWDGDPLRIER